MSNDTKHYDPSLNTGSITIKAQCHHRYHEKQPVMIHTPGLRYRVNYKDCPWCGQRCRVVERDDSHDIK